MSRTYNNKKQIEGRIRKKEREEAKKAEIEKKIKEEEDKTWLIGAKTPTQRDFKIQKDNERLEKKKALQKKYEEEFNSM
jgi:hypothetical protein